MRLGQGLFKSDYISRYLHTWVLLRFCIIVTIGESPLFAPNIVIDIKFIDLRRGKS